MKNLDPAGYLRAPDWKLTRRKRETFDALFAAASDGEPGALIDYRCDYPKYQFLAYLAEHKGVLLHGSNNGNIAVLRPKRQTNYNGDPVRVVFAAADGIWPMFFAILDREVYEGSIRNGCFWVTDEAGGGSKGYHFSINAAILEGEPWTDGMIYILPRDSFEQERDLAGELLEEWVSRVPVRPLARLPVAPADFPFLDQIQGHDEATLERLGQVPGELFKGFQELRELPDGYAVRYAGAEPWDAKLMEFIRLQRKDSPSLTFALVFDPEGGPIRLELRGRPEDKALIKDQIHTFLDARNTP